MILGDLGNKDNGGDEFFGDMNYDDVVTH